MSNFNLNKKTLRTRPRKFSGHCEACGKPVCACKAYQHTDDSNGAISASAQYLCRDCYEKRYGVTIQTDVDAYKSRLTDKFRRYALMSKDDKMRKFFLHAAELIEKTD